MGPLRPTGPHPGTTGRNAREKPMNPRRIVPIGMAGVLILLAIGGSAALSPSLTRAENDSSATAPTPNDPDEPMADGLSLARSAAFLDAVALDWTRKRQCGTC